MERIIEKVTYEAPVQPKATRVAAYARVSSGKDAMLHSLSAQISYYSETIQSHKGWICCGVYSDEAQTGTKDSRPGFRQMIEDCRSGKLDLILVKSISRLSRNTVTLLDTVRELRRIGVDIYFEEQNIHTISSEGELMVTILASYAQEEALSVSENQKWRVRKNFKEGRPWNCTMLGYRNVDGTLIVVPEEADTVRRIFQMYLSGMGTQTIANILNNEGIQTRLGNEFNHTGIQKILNNYAYTGNLLLQKTFSEDAISKRVCVNQGELPMYHATETHEAIIGLDDYDRVQEEQERRAGRYARQCQPKKAYPFTSLITCAKCGKHYRRKINKTGAVWICGTFNHKGKAACSSKQIPESTLLAMTEDMDMSRVYGITADDGNRLIFFLNDGKTIEKVWRDRSRAESWTDEMRKKASEQAKARYQKWQQEV